MTEQAGRSKAEMYKWPPLAILETSIRTVGEEETTLERPLQQQKKTLLAICLIFLLKSAGACKITPPPRL